MCANFTLVFSHIGGISLNQRLELVSAGPPCEGALGSQPTTSLQAGYCCTDLRADQTHVSVFFKQFWKIFKFFNLKVECEVMTEDMVSKIFILFSDLSDFS